MFATLSECHSELGKSIKCHDSNNELNLSLSTEDIRTSYRAMPRGGGGVRGGQCTGLQLTTYRDNFGKFPHKLAIIRYAFVQM